MVRFGGHSFEEDMEWCEPPVKDSGVDTCSSTTLNEDHSNSHEKVPPTHLACILSLLFLSCELLTYLIQSLLISVTDCE